jgi:hypothetical protein
MSRSIRRPALALALLLTLATAACAEESTTDPGAGGDTTAETAAEPGGDTSADTGDATAGSDDAASTSAAPAGAEESAAAAAGFLAGQLEEGSHFPEDEGSLTVDGLIALAAAGGHDSEVAAMADWLAEQAPAYTEGNGPAAGSLAVAVAAAGQDPTDFGGLDLTEVVVESIDDTGQCGEFAGAYTQSLCVLGLVRAEAEVPQEAVDNLVALQDAETGSFGFDSEGEYTPDLDSTALAVSALSGVLDQDGAVDAVVTARDYLLGEQAEDGSWQGFSAVNTTGLAASALAALGEDVQPAVDWLTGVQLSDGGFAAEQDGELADVRATTQGILPLTGESLLSVGVGGLDRVEVPAGR